MHHLLLFILALPRRRHDIVTRVSVLAERGEGLDVFFFEHGDVVLGFARLAAVHEVVEWAGDMFGEAGLDGEFCVVGADEEGEGVGVDYTVLYSCVSVRWRIGLVVSI